MIRLLGLSLPRLGLAGSQASYFGGKKLFKNAKSQNSVAGQVEGIGREKRQDKNGYIRGPSLRDNAQEIDKKWQTENASRTFFPPIDHLLTKSQLEQIESKIASQQATLLR